MTGADDRLKVLVIGALGKMGRAVCDAVSDEPDLELAAVVDAAGREVVWAGPAAAAAAYVSLDECLEKEKPDVAVDFTTPGAAFENVTACLKKGINCIVGTTGIKEHQLKQIELECRLSGASCLIAPNFAIGAVLMMDIAQVVARYMPFCEITELHHDQKLDAPSGTALRTAEMIAAARLDCPEPPGPEGNVARGLAHHGIPIHSVRLPGLVAHQEIIFGGQGQTLTVRHDSISRQSFMPGVVMAVRRVASLDGLAVGLEKIM